MLAPLISTSFILSSNLVFAKQMTPPPLLKFFTSRRWSLPSLIFPNPLNSFFEGETFRRGKKIYGARSLVSIPLVEREIDAVYQNLHALYCPESPHIKHLKVSPSLLSPLTSHLLTALSYRCCFHWISHQKCLISRFVFHKLPSHLLL